MNPAAPQWQHSWAKWLVLAMVAAVLANGAPFYLKRVGLVDREAYQLYWANHCVELDGTIVRERPCLANVTKQEATDALLRGGYAQDYYGYLYQVSAAERPLKLAKDILVLGLLLLSAWVFARERAGGLWSAARAAWPLTALLGYCLLSFAASTFGNGAIVAAAGLRSFMFIGIALLGGWLAPQVGLFAAGAAALLAFESSLMPLELVRGIHLFLEWSPLDLASRTAGTLVQPNSMGVFAACGLAFCISFLPARRALPLLGVVTLALVLLSGSATGLLCLSFLALMLARRRLPQWVLPWDALALVLLMLAVMLILPGVLGRDDLYESIWSEGGRVGVLHMAIVAHTPMEVLFGRGLGVNTNLALNLLGSAGQNALGAANPTEALPTDSTFVGLVIQIGLLGTILFYAALFWAGRRDPSARLFYCVVAMASLTLNVTELFPVNMLLGIALAHSVWPAPDWQTGGSA
jgi:hypothetical protein